MRLGYSYWGFLGDYKLDSRGNELSAPDGNATYSWSIVSQAQKQGWDVWMMQQDRDWPAFVKHGRFNFESFSQQDRFNAYLKMFRTHGETLPELDVLLLEWRFPIPGRNFQVDQKDPNYQPDLDRQKRLLKHYKEQGTKIIIWDLDHKLVKIDEFAWEPDAIFETSHSPLKLHTDRVRVEPPVLISNLLELPTIAQNSNRKMVYIGSRYERDDVIQKYLAPVSNVWPGQIEFWGNWTREPNLSECKHMWPNFSYNGRITTRDFRKVYGDAVCCPLLAKQSYLDSGFITPRPWEALLFGTIPVGIAEAKGIEDYTLFQATNADDFRSIAQYLSDISLPTRNKLRMENIQKLHFMDASHFIRKIEEVVQ